MRVHACVHGRGGVHACAGHACVGCVHVHECMHVG